MGLGSSTFFHIMRFLGTTPMNPPLSFIVEYGTNEYQTK